MKKVYPILTLLFIPLAVNAQKEMLIGKIGK